MPYCSPQAPHAGPTRLGGLAKSVSEITYRRKPKNPGEIVSILPCGTGRSSLRVSYIGSTGTRCQPLLRWRALCITCPKSSRGIAESRWATIFMNSIDQRPRRAGRNRSQVHTSNQSCAVASDLLVYRTGQNHRKTRILVLRPFRVTCGANEPETQGHLQVKYAFRRAQGIGIS